MNFTPIYKAENLLKFIEKFEHNFAKLTKILTLRLIKNKQNFEHNFSELPQIKTLRLIKKETEL